MRRGRFLRDAFDGDVDAGRGTRFGLVDHVRGLVLLAARRPRTTSTLTSVSGLLPESSTFTVNVGLAPPLIVIQRGRRFEGGGADAHSDQRGAMRARRDLTARRGAGGLTGETCEDGARFEPAEVRQELRAGGALPLDAAGRERLLDQRRDALGPDHVGGQEQLHRAGDVAARLLVALTASAVRTRFAIFASPSERRLKASSRLRCARLHFAGHAQALARAKRRVWACSRSWLTSSSTSSADLPDAPASVSNNGSRDLLIGFLRRAGSRCCCIPSEPILCRSSDSR